MLWYLYARFGRYIPEDLKLNTIYMNETYNTNTTIDIKWEQIKVVLYHTLEDNTLFNT